MLAVPNFSAGRDADAIAAIHAALGGAVRVLDVHSDEVHDRSVFTLSAPPASLVGALAAGAEAARAVIDIDLYVGAHPAIGALDVAPLVWLHEEERESARDAAMAAAREIADGGIAVFLYGELASSDERRERSFFRRGGLTELRARMGAGELEPDFGPAHPHPSAGATLVTARPPLAAFNVVLAGLDADGARDVAARLREGGGGGGLAGVRAIAIDLGGDAMQISTNVHDPVSLPLAEVVERVLALAAERGGRVVSAEIVGLVPEAALTGFPAAVPIEGFDAERQLIERS
jgi:glutamate formiminotransferase/glutamate formiminotransferase/formiminotetrahydrofolate cyclodeaminase